MLQRDIAQVPYPYAQYSPSIAAPSPTQLTEGAHPAPSYARGYGSLTQSALGPYRSDPYYYSQSSGAPVAPTTPTTPTIVTEGSYSHQYMPFRQTQPLQYIETSLPLSSQLSASPQSSQRLTSPEQLVSEQRSQSAEEAKYGSVRSWPIGGTFND
jgi:hypothetical protein